MEIVKKIEGQLVTSRNFVGMKIFDNEGNTCGKVEDFLIDDRMWTIRYFVARTGGFFNRERVLISPFLLRQTAADSFDEGLSTTLTKEQVEDCPPLDSDAPVSRRYEQELARYYQYPSYWHGPNLWGLVSSPGLVANPGVSINHERHEERMEEISRSHVRSIDTITSYQAYAGVEHEEVGKVDYFIIETGTWIVRYLVIETTEALGGKKIVLSPEWVSDISWDEGQIKFDSLSHAVIKAVPKFDDSGLISSDYEEQVFSHYEQFAYWHP